MIATQNKQKGFTLIELLVVIAIIAILAVVVILTLNPAELLRQARDSNRISDLNTLKSAISLYLSDVATPSITTSSLNCYISSSGATNVTTSAKCGMFTVAGALPANMGNGTANFRQVNGTGWIPINFTQISSGAPVGNLPVDPINNMNYYYGYAATSALTFELDAFMESVKFGSTGAGNVVTNDGGDNGGNQGTCVIPGSNCANLYEVGTAPGLAL